MIDRVLSNSYRIVEKVGEGGMGAVYRAVDLMLDRDVAIKAIRPELAREPEIVERFRSEARLLARVSHPAIATIYSFFQDGDDLFLAMEFVRGRSLSRVLESEGALPWDQAVRLLSAAMEGIEVAHRAGIIHRDLKPDNLMIGEIGNVKVMDFGIARAAGSGHLTRTGLLVGTLRYMAPEQIQGEEADHRVDIYALGTVLYQTITGRSPFDGKSDYAIIKAQIEEMPPPPSTVVPGIPGWLDRAVLRALAKKPADRFQSVEEMRRFLATRGGTVTGGEATRVTGTRPEIAELPTIVTPPRAAPRPSIPTAASQPQPEAGSYQPIPSGGMGWKLAVGIAAVLAVLTGVGVALWSGEEPEEIVAENVAGTVPAQSLAVAPPPAQPAAEPLPTAAPERTPERKPRLEPTPFPRPEPTPAVQEPVTPVVETPAAPQPEPSPEVVEGIPAAPIEELRRLGGELQAESTQLLETYLAFLEKKENGGADITDADEELESLIEAFSETAEKLNNQVTGGGFFARLRNRKDTDARPQLEKRFKALADRGVQVDRLMNQVQPGPEVRQAWQGIRTRWQRVGTIISGLK
ncbi:MAG: eukaryotic-like serine/threonine-protein kinase [Acidobacteriota bacterium]|jgi:serine/threonine-protein kinase|nr:eukaryotic-like serine/threonine-protein kinase [Acidobacteriota bacterium]